MSNNKFGLSSFGEETPRFNKGEGKDFGPRIPFMKLKDGNNVVRIATAPYKYAMIKFKATADAPGYGKRIVCSEPVEDCPTSKTGTKASSRRIVGIIDRADQTVKLLDYGKLVIDQLKDLNDDIEWGSPNTYDIVIKRNPKGGAANYYSVIPRGKAPLSPADNQLLAELGSKLEENLVRLTKAPSAESVKAKLEEAGWTGEPVVASAQGKDAELAQSDESDYSFDDAAAAE